MSLESLPSEILSNIFSYVGNSQPEDSSSPLSADVRYTLLDASLTCRRVSIHSQLALFRAVRFEVHQRLLLPPWAIDNRREPDEALDEVLDAEQDDAYLQSVARLEALAQVCAANPLLRDAVKELDINWEMDLNGDYGWELSVLEMLMPNINPSAKINIEILLHWRGPKEPPTHRYQRNPRTVNERRCQILIQRDPFYTPSPAIKNYRPVTRIHASDRPALIEVLERVLSPNLGRIDLEMQIPGDNAVVNRKTTRWSSRRGFDLHEQLSPVQIQQRCLDKVEGNIMHLRLNSYAAKLTGGHDGSRVDLRAFNGLDSLEIDGDLLFGNSPSTAGEAGVNLHCRLPPNLRSLKVLFPRGQGIFWSLPTVRKLQLSAADQLINSTLVLDEGRTALAWLNELLENRESKLPKLLSIWLEEEEVSGPWYDYRIMSWPLPGWLQQRADACGVRVLVNFRVPNGARILPDWGVVYEFEPLRDTDEGLDTDHEYDEYY
ncbi:hypothetical protein GQ53DRAFT_744668 [Thozetella sp. PMI_491]|nr:hypothetical protein GQ53DRAFT_744668 [Thozetella sp. PMI_491]